MWGYIYFCFWFFGLIFSAPLVIKPVMDQYLNLSDYNEFLDILIEADTYFVSLDDTPLRITIDNPVDIPEWIVHSETEFGYSTGFYSSCYALMFEVKDDVLFMVCYEGKVAMFNISDISSPLRLPDFGSTYFDLEVEDFELHNTRYIEIQGDFLFIAHGVGGPPIPTILVSMYNIADIFNTSWVSSYPTGYDPETWPKMNCDLNLLCVFYSDDNTVFEVVDFSDFDSPVSLGTTPPLSCYAGLDMITENNITFLSCLMPGEVLMIDHTDPTNPQLLGTCCDEMETSSYFFDKCGDYLFVGDYKTANLTVIEVLDYETGDMAEIITIPVYSSVARCKYDEHGSLLVFVTGKYGSYDVFDFSDVLNPELLYNESDRVSGSPGYYEIIYLPPADDYPNMMFSSKKAFGTYVYDISNVTIPRSESITTIMPTNYRAESIVVTEDTVYVATGISGIEKIDISNMTDPKRVEPTMYGTEFFGEYDFEVVDLAIHGDYMFAVGYIPDEGRCTDCAFCATCEDVEEMACYACENFYSYDYYMYNYEEYFYLYEETGQRYGSCTYCDPEWYDAEYYYEETLNVDDRYIGFSRYHFGTGMLAVIDISEPDDPRMVYYNYTDFPVRSIFVDERVELGVTFGYIQSEIGMLVVDLTDPLEPTYVDTVRTTFGNSKDMKLVKDKGDVLLLFIDEMVFAGGVTILNVSNPYNATNNGLFFQGDIVSGFDYDVRLDPETGEKIMEKVYILSEEYNPWGIPFASDCEVTEVRFNESENCGFSDWEDCQSCEDCEMYWDAETVGGGGCGFHYDHRSNKMLISGDFQINVFDKTDIDDPGNLERNAYCDQCEHCVDYYYSEYHEYYGDVVNPYCGDCEEMVPLVETTSIDLHPGTLFMGNRNGGIQIFTYNEHIRMKQNASREDIACGEHEFSIRVEDRTGTIFEDFKIVAKKDGYIDQFCLLYECLGELGDGEDPLDFDPCFGNGNCSENGTICGCGSGFDNSTWCRSCLDSYVMVNPHLCVFDPYCFGVLQNESESCGEHGDCMGADICECHKYWNGKYCNITECYSILEDDFENVCNGHGDCVAPNTCNCQGGYYGSHCNTTTCYGVFSNETDEVCSGNGYCWPYDTCHCPAGYYYGEFCNITRCGEFLSNDSTNSECNGHGSCGPVFGECHCVENYYGEMCNITQCGGVMSNDTMNVCSGSGICSIFERCDCHTNYYGEECNVTTCDGIFSNISSSCTGGEYGRCWPFGICSCLEGYYGEFCNITECFGHYSNTSDVCSSHGTCWPLDDCDCYDYDFYFGANCNETFCNGNPSDSDDCCSGHGKCWPYEKCNCFENYYGEDCNVTTCDEIYSNDTESICSGKGVCSVYEECQCVENYYGYCEISTCFGYWSNDSSVEEFICSGHGTCSDYNLCQCSYINETDTGGEEGFFYFGERCNISKCFDYLSNETDEVCSNHGECLDMNTCECDGLYNYSVNCERYKCYGYLDNDNENVCSGHGKCLSPDDCECFDDIYGGENCQFWSCNNISALEVNEVCSGNGFCIDQDICLCKTGYSSQFCSEWFCGSHFYTDKEACNERGECTGSHSCTCFKNYEGSLCETWSCGLEYTNPMTCSGKGECESPDVCSCNSGFKGDLCETNTMYGTVMAPILSVSAIGGVVLVCCFVSCILCCFLFCGCVFVGSVVILCGLTLNLRFRVKKFQKLKNFDILLKEQELEEDESVAHIRIDRSLFEVPMDEIKLERIIGEGGSLSVVYLATWKNRKVAFKCFKTRNVCASQNSFDEFEREIAVLGSINHPNIIQCYGCSMKPPRVGIVMEYCSNGDMEDFFVRYKDKNGISYPMKEKIRMMIETSSAIDYCHSRNIIHRDLKPENVLVDENEACKLMDFGLSKIVDRMSRQKTKRVGTTCYMAPEITLGSGKYDQKVDVFSFGVMIWVIATELYQPFGFDAYQKGNIEMKMANDPLFRPDSYHSRTGESGDELNEEEFERIHMTIKKAVEGRDIDLEGFSETGEDLMFLQDLARDCWKHDPDDRPDFKEISRVLQENYDRLFFLDGGKDGVEGGKKKTISSSGGRTSSSVRPRIEIVKKMVEEKKEERKKRMIEIGIDDEEEDEKDWIISSLSNEVEDLRCQVEELLEKLRLAEMKKE